MKQLKGSVRAVIAHHIWIVNAYLMTINRHGGHLTQERNTMPSIPPTMLDQVGRNATQHDDDDDASWGEVAIFVAGGLFIVYGMPWIITWVSQWVRG